MPAVRRERPITIPVEMIELILEGKKTQARIPLTPQPKGDRALALPDGWGFDVVPIGASGLPRKLHSTIHCPFGPPGSHLWVREPTLRVEERGLDGPALQLGSVTDYSTLFGLGFGMHQSRQGKRIEILLLIAMLANVVVMVAGLHVRDSGQQRRYQSNSIRHRNVLSVWRLGLEWLRRHEPSRDSRRLQTLRGWSHEHVETILPRGTPAGGPYGL